MCVLDRGRILIVCDVGQEGVGGEGVMEMALWPEGNPLLSPIGRPFACLSHSCVCVCVSE